MYRIRCDFSSCLDSTESLGNANSFRVKKCPCFFFHKWENKASNTFMKITKSFLSGFRAKTTQEHLFTSHRSASEVWVDSDILENFSRNGSYMVVARSHSIVSIFFCLLEISTGIFFNTKRQISVDSAQL